jgi:hypothetical protein
MERRLRLTDVLRTWQEQVAQQDIRGTHLAVSEMYALATQQRSPAEEQTAFAHLLRCAACRAGWSELRRDIAAAEMTDTIHLQAAASREAVGFTELQTNNGKFTVTVRPSVSPGAPWLITVTVNRPEDRECWEGLTIQLRKTGQERPFLQGQIIDGEVVQILEVPIKPSDLDGAMVQEIAEAIEEG